MSCRHTRSRLSAYLNKRAAAALRVECCAQGTAGAEMRVAGEGKAASRRGGQARQKVLRTRSVNGGRRATPCGSSGTVACSQVVVWGEGGMVIHCASPSRPGEHRTMVLTVQTICSSENENTTNRTRWLRTGGAWWWQAFHRSVLYQRMDSLAVAWCMSIPTE